MKPHISATLAALLLFLSACAGAKNVDMADRRAGTQPDPCERTKHMQFTKDGDAFQDPGQATRLLSECLAASPDTPAAYRASTLIMRAIAYAQQKEYKQAIADREEALRLIPARTGWDVIGLASNYRDDGQPERAVELLRKMLQDNLGLRGKGTTPGMPSYYHLGRALIDLQQWQGAAEAFSEGMTYQPDFAWAYAYRGLAYDRMNQPELAQADIGKARSLIEQLKPDNREIGRQSFQKPPFAELMKKYPD